MNWFEMLPYWKGKISKRQSFFLLGLFYITEKKTSFQTLKLLFRSEVAEKNFKAKQKQTKKDLIIKQ